MCARSFIIANIHSSLGLCRLRCSAATMSTEVIPKGNNKKRARVPSSPKEKVDSPVKPPPTPNPDPPGVSSSSSPDSHSRKRQRIKPPLSNNSSAQRNSQAEFARWAEKNANYSTPEATLSKHLQQLSNMMKPSIRCLEKTGAVVSDLFGTPSSYPEFTDAWKKAACGVMWLQEGLMLVTEAENLLLCPPEPPPTNANLSAAQD